MGQVASTNGKGWLLQVRYCSPIRVPADDHVLETAARITDDFLISGPRRRLGDLGGASTWEDSGEALPEKTQGTVQDRHSSGMPSHNTGWIA